MLLDQFFFSICAFFRHTNQPVQVVSQIRAELNPHPAGQKELNTPKEEGLTGVQHKYDSTVTWFKRELFCRFSIQKMGPNFFQSDKIPLDFVRCFWHDWIAGLVFSGRWSNLPCILHLLLSMGAIHWRFGSQICTERCPKPLHLSGKAPWSQWQVGKNFWVCLQMMSLVCFVPNESNLNWILYWYLFVIF